MNKEAFELLCTLAKIPAPSNDEGLRAEFVKNWLEGIGAKDVYIDDALNVIYSVGNKTAPTYIFMAHSDVVFPDKDELPLEIRDGKIYCPGVGDDTAHVVSMLMVIKEIVKNNLQPKDKHILFVINSGEEGLGNLKGSRKIMEDFGKNTVEFITFDGALPYLHRDPVGSKRFNVEVKTKGGHSYQAFGNKNAIACLSQLICEYYKTEVPTDSKTTYNVGTITGGTSVNTIAQNASALFEYRSDKKSGLDYMQSQFDKIIDKYKNEFEINVTVVGDRPCANGVDEDAHNALCERAASAVKRVCGDTKFIPGSTDCNIPASMGIPAVCVSCVVTKGAHTRGEWVEIDSIDGGIEIARQLIMYHFGE